MRTLLLAAALLLPAAAGCKTVYLPTVVDGEVRAGVVVPPRLTAADRPIAPSPVPGEPGRYVVYRAHRVVDWDGIGRVAGDVLEGTGYVLLGAAEVTLRVAAACCGCHGH